MYYYVACDFYRQERT